MSSFNVIRPRDDSAAKESSKWCDDLIAKLKASTAAHTVSSDIDDGSPADQANISAAMSAGVDLICYFGHGNSSAWLTANSPTIDAGTVGAGKGKAVVSHGSREKAEMDVFRLHEHGLWATMEHDE